MLANLSSFAARAGGLDLCAVEAPCGGVCGGAVGLYQFCFVIRLFDPSFPPIFSLILV